MLKSRMLRFILVSLMLCSCAGKISSRQARLKEIETEGQNLELLYSSKKISQQDYYAKKLTLLDAKFRLELENEQLQYNKKQFAVMSKSLSAQPRESTMYKRPEDH